MNQEEQTVDKFLRTLALGTPIFEPEGFKKPPDFMLPPAIGIEVRRLNQNYFDGDDTAGLEEFSIPLHALFKKVLESFDSRFAGRTFWVGLTYKRPIVNSMKTIGHDLTKTLEAFIRAPTPVPCDLSVNENLQLEIRPSESPVPNRVFRRAITSDENAGGLVVQTYIDNIVHCVREKSSKLIPVKAKYPVRWLILVDTMMSWYLEDYEVEQVKGGITDFREFSRILVLDYFGDNSLLDMINPSP